ncbi:MAG TPA: hypothetical protein VGL23_04565 [Chloroflexota bacterium]|jgi:hypothetical protein
MPRPTPARILYLVVGLVLGLAVMLGLQGYLRPSLASSLPFGLGTAAAPAPSGPIQFTGGALERIQPVNLTQDRGGVAIRVNTLELYKDGFIFTYSLISPRGGAAPPTLEPETFQVADDRGTAYTISPLGTTAAASAGFTAGMASFTPAPPAEVRALRITVPNALAIGLRIREGQSRVVAGPWEFQVPIQR